MSVVDQHSVAIFLQDNPIFVVHTQKAIAGEDVTIKGISVFFCQQFFHIDTY